MQKVEKCVENFNKCKCNINWESMIKYVKIWESVPKSEKMCKNLRKYKKSVPKVEKVWKSVQQVEKVCQKLRKCANSWESVSKVEKS